MAPSTTITTSIVNTTDADTHNDICTEYNNILQDDFNHYQKHVQTSKIISPYDQVLPKNESKLFVLIRNLERRMGFVTPILWLNAISIILFHVVTCMFTLYYSLYYADKLFRWKTVLYVYLLGQIAGFGVTAGVHRYWTHRSFKAKLPLQIILLLAYSVAGQIPIFEWVRDHRIHHKFSETSADPHDARRGFFFSHVGWLMMKKHPDVLREGKKIDMSDIVNDPLVKFHSKYFTVFKLTCCFIVPIVIGVVVCGQDWDIAIVTQMLLRYMLSLNFTWSVNSFAHLWGHKPYDRNIMPCENWKVSFFAMGEGWHNYHHTFPWDYKAAELSYFVNVTTLLLDMFGAIGWAYDMKKASPSLIKAVARKRGTENGNFHGTY